MDRAIRDNELSSEALACLKCITSSSVGVKYLGAIPDVRIGAGGRESHTRLGESQRRDAQGGTSRDIGSSGQV